jgi:hypothetical protein
VNSRRLNALAALCLLAVAALTFADDGLVARIFGAIMFFGAGMAVAEARHTGEHSNN